jgi:hypothetical protein
MSPSRSGGPPRRGRRRGLGEELTPISPTTASGARSRPAARPDGGGRAGVREGEPDASRAGEALSSWEGMAKKLVIAEKPSVAREIAAALPEKLRSHGEYFEGPSYLVSYAIGHLVTLAEPEDYDPSLKQWRSSSSLSTTRLAAS